jgi:hypothetical protein
MSIHFYPPKLRDTKGRFKKRTGKGSFRDAKGHLVSARVARRSSIARTEYASYVNPSRLPAGYTDAPLSGKEAVKFRDIGHAKFKLETTAKTPSARIKQIRREKPNILEQEDKKS